MYCATQVHYFVNHCCSNLLSSGTHVHWRVTVYQLHVTNCKQDMHTLVHGTVPYLSDKT
jgi:hypothetical protein